MGLEREAGRVCIAVQVQEPESVDLEQVFKKGIFSQSQRVWLKKKKKSTFGWAAGLENYLDIEWGQEMWL